MSLAEARALVGPEMPIGGSTHKPHQASRAQTDGADYIGVGPMFPTKTKLGVEPSEGLEYLSWVAENIDLPRVAIGGISLENIEQVRVAGQNQGGSSGMEFCNQWYAVISAVMGASSIGERIADFANEIKNGDLLRE